MTGSNIMARYAEDAETSDSKPAVSTNAMPITDQESIREKFNRRNAGYKHHQQFLQQFDVLRPDLTTKDNGAQEALQTPAGTISKEKVPSTKKEGDFTFSDKKKK